MARDVMLTTKDNPCDPFDDYSNWLAEDIARGYHTNELLARIAEVSTNLSPVDYQAGVERAMDKIIKMDPNYIKVEKDVDGGVFDFIGT